MNLTAAQKEVTLAALRAAFKCGEGRMEVLAKSPPHERAYKKIKKAHADEMAALELKMSNIQDAYLLIKTQT